MTACVAVYRPDRRELTWTTAGHPPPLVISAPGTVGFLGDGHGPPLGVDLSTDHDGYGTTTRRMSTDECLLLYTDGLVEARTTTIDDGLDRLRALAGGQRPTLGLPARLYRELHPTERHPDDIAVVAVVFG